MPHLTGGQDRMFAIVKDLIDRSAPLDGTGAQGHFGRGVTPPGTVLKRLDRFPALGLPIEITEFDVNTPGDALKADSLRDYYTACFSHESVNGIVMWGFWSGRHWEPAAALFAPAGTAATRGFLGEYEITATLNGKSKTVTATLKKGAAALEVRLP